VSTHPRWGGAKGRSFGEWAIHFGESAWGEWLLWERVELLYYPKCNELGIMRGDENKRNNEFCWGGVREKLFSSFLSCLLVVFLLLVS